MTEEQQLQQSSPHAYYSPPAIATIPNLLQQTNPDVILELIEHHLKGEVWQEQEKKWAVKYSPFLNEKGVNTIMTMLRGLINHNTILSNLGDKDIANLMHGVIDQIVILLYTRWKEFEIDKAHLTPIADLICNNAFFSLKRAYDNGERDFYTKSIQENRVVAQRPPPERQDRKFSFGNIFKT